jgi:DNA-binding transcriptional MerR regulator
MHPSLSIGDFARATHLSVKTLRFYHRSGLLDPAEIDPNSGYRRYGIDQIPTAQVIRRFRALDMPLIDIRSVLAAPDIDTRNELIAAHLRRLEAELTRTQGAVVSLRDLLEHPSASSAIEHRTVDAVRAAAITQVVDVKDAAAWHQGALGELYASLSAQGIESSGPAGGIFSNELFAEERGIATIFVPCEMDVRPLGRIAPFAVPAVELAMTVHRGPDNGIDREYGALAAYVTQHALAVDGPIREYYLVGAHETSDTQAWCTEIGWPIFATGSTRQPGNA